MIWLKCFCTPLNSDCSKYILSWFIRNKCYAQSIKPPLSGLALKVNNLQMSVLTQIQCPSSIHLQEEGICMFYTFLWGKVQNCTNPQHKTSNELLSESPTCIGLPRHDNSSFLPCKILSRKYPDSHTEDGDTATIHQLFKYITLSAPKQHWTIFFPDDKAVIRIRVRASSNCLDMADRT